MPAIKFADAARTALDICLVPFGGSINGRDMSREAFSAKTNLCLDWFPDARRPLLYHHGLDAGAGVTPVGYLTDPTVKADGVWFRAQLDAHNRYYADICDLIDQDALGASSGAMAHLVKVNGKTGHIDQWPLVEGSLTPTPCEPVLARVSFAEAKAHFKSAGLDLPERLLKAADVHHSHAHAHTHDHEHTHPATMGKAALTHRHPHDHLHEHHHGHDYADEQDHTTHADDAMHAHDHHEMTHDHAHDDLPGGMGQPGMADRSALGGVGSALVAANGKAYGTYRDADGVVRLHTLDAAIREVATADLPDSAKALGLARAQALILEHGYGDVLTVPALPGGGPLARVKTAEDFRQLSSHDKIQAHYDLLAAGVETLAPDPGSLLALRAVWSTAFQNDLPDASFLYIEPGGEKDGEGKTTPRSKRHFPVRDKDGSVDEAHVRNALARIPQSTLPADVKERALAKARRLAKQVGIDVSDEAAKAASAIRAAAARDASDYERSYEDIKDDLLALLNPRSPWGSAGYTSIVATYPDHVICCRWDDDGDQTYWHVSYTIDETGEPRLGTTQQVAQTYLPVTKAVRLESPLIDEASALVRDVRGFGGRAKALLERRVKEGRVFSAANVRSLTEVADTLTTSAETIHALLAQADHTGQAQAKAAYLASDAYRQAQIAVWQLAAHLPAAE